MRDKPLFIATIIFSILFLVFLLTIFSPLGEIFSPFITAMALVYFLSPCVKWLEKFKIKPMLATFIIYAVIAMIAVFAIAFAIPAVNDAVVKILGIVSSYFDKEYIGTIPPDVLLGSAGGVYTTLMNVVKSLLSVFVGIVAAFYILSDKKASEKFSELIPEGIKPSFKLLADDIKMCLDSFFKGQILIAAILFLIVSAFLFFMGIDYAVGLGAIAAILDIVPYAGAIIASVLIVLVTLITAPQKTIIVIIGLLVIQQIENNIITPKVSSDTLSLHPSVTVLALYLGAFGGFWGILLSIPLTCILKKLCQRLIQSIV